MAANPQPEENLLERSSEQRMNDRLDALLAKMAEKNTSHAKAMMMGLMAVRDTIMARAETTHVVDPREILLVMMEMCRQLHERVRADEHSGECSDKKEDH